jgi:hypothetical protein
MALCEGCGTELGVLEALRWSVCMACTKARQRTVTRNHGRCTCGRKRRPWKTGTSIRSWVACLRCLGVIEQLN